MTDDDLSPVRSQRDRNNRRHDPRDAVLEIVIAEGEMLAQRQAEALREIMKWLASRQE